MSLPRGPFGFLGSSEHDSPSQTEKDAMELEARANHALDVLLNAMRALEPVQSEAWHATAVADRLGLNDEARAVHSTLSEAYRVLNKLRIAIEGIKSGAQRMQGL